MASGACSGKVALTFHRSVIPNSSRENPFEPEKDRFERGDSNGKYIYIYVNKECGQQERPKNIEKWYHIATLQQMKGAMAEDKSFHQMLSKKSLVI